MKSGLFGLALLGLASVGYGAEYVVEPGQTIAEAIKKAAPGDTIYIEPGTYNESLFIDKANISLIGRPKDGQWPVLDGQGKLNDGVIASGSGFKVEWLHIRNYKANGVTTQAADNVVMRHLLVENTGIYGIYPTLGQNIVIEDNVTWGIADAGIYVGMCRHVDVRRNEAFDNVAGIEAENSHDVLIENNNFYRNTSGVLVFTLPELPRKSCSNIVVRGNFITDNNLMNFGAKGSIVASGPPGVGSLVLAADDVLFENNIIRNNSFGGIIVAHHGVVPHMAKDPEVEPNPDRVRIMKNIFQNNGHKDFGDMVVWARYVVKQIISTGVPEGAEDGIMPIGADVIGTNMGTGNCIYNSGSLKLKDTKVFSECQESSVPPVTTMLVDSSKLVSDKSPDLGKRTFEAICAGCHALNYRLIGPPIREIQAKYPNNPAGIAAFATAPQKVRSDFPQMPPQAYLGGDALTAVAGYMLRMTPQ